MNDYNWQPGEPFSVPDPLKPGTSVYVNGQKGVIEDYKAVDTQPNPIRPPVWWRYSVKMDYSGKTIVVDDCWVGVIF